MSETYHLRQQLIAIARQDKGKVELTKNRAPWIEKLWPATSEAGFYKIGNADYPQGNPPYCAAGMAYCVREWLRLPAVLAAFGFTAEAADKWRCKSPGAFEWLNWAQRRGLQVLPAKGHILHAADIVIYEYSHIELVTDDDNTTGGLFVAIGYNTNAAGSRDGEGCFEKPRSRDKVKAFVRLLA